MHGAIQQGQTTCRGVVQAYLDRAKAYNGVRNALVTADGAPIPRPPGQVRAGAPLTFPTQTVAIVDVLPDLDEYPGPPIEFGRMEPTASDPSVQQQYGMIVGMPNAGQVNALGTINIRGERSVTCKGDLDKASVGGRAAGRRAGGLRGVPQAARRARARGGARRASTAASPTWRRCRCTASRSRSRIRSTRRTCGRPAAAMRATTSTSRRAITRSSRSCAHKGAIIYAKAVHHRVQRARRRSRAARTSRQGPASSNLGYQRSTWAGNPSQPLRHHARRRRSARARDPACRSAPTW